MAKVFYDQDVNWDVMKAKKSQSSVMAARATLMR